MGKPRPYGGGDVVGRRCYGGGAGAGVGKPRPYGEGTGGLKVAGDRGLSFSSFDRRSDS